MPKIAILCARYGEPTKIYINRQVEAFRETPEILAWQNLSNQTIRQLGIPFKVSRLTARLSPLLSLLGINPFAAPRRERLLLRSQLQEINPNIILVHTGHLALRVFPIARSLGIPVFVYFHGVDFTPALKNPAYKKFLQRFLREFAGTVVVGRYMMPWMLENGVHERRLFYIPCGAPTSMRESVSDSAGPSDSINLLVVSRLVRWKGVDIAIRAFRDLLETVPSATLKIVGDGPERKELESLATNLNVCEKVIFEGEKTPAEIELFYRHADIFVHLPVDDWGGPEAFGVVVTEAASHGLALVCSACGGIVDQVDNGESAILVPQHDPKAAAEAMMKLSANKDLRRTMGLKAKERSKAFDAQFLARKLEDALNETVCQQGR